MQEVFFTSHSTYFMEKYSWVCTWLCPLVAVPFLGKVKYQIRPPPLKLTNISSEKQCQAKMKRQSFSFSHSTHQLQLQSLMQTDWSWWPTGNAEIKLGHCLSTCSGSSIMKLLIWLCWRIILCVSCSTALCAVEISIKCSRLKLDSIYRDVSLSLFRNSRVVIINPVTAGWQSSVLLIKSHTDKK